MGSKIALCGAQGVRSRPPFNSLSRWLISVVHRVLPRGQAGTRIGPASSMWCGSVCPCGQTDTDSAVDCEAVMLETTGIGLQGCEGGSGLWRALGEMPIRNSACPTSG